LGIYIISTYSDTRGYEIGVSAAPVDRDSIYHEVDIAPSFPGGDESIVDLLLKILLDRKGQKVRLFW
jgi:hypothetical protein